MCEREREQKKQKKTIQKNGISIKMRASQGTKHRYGLHKSYKLCLKNNYKLQSANKKNNKQSERRTKKIIKKILKI